MRGSDRAWRCLAAIGVALGLAGCTAAGTGEEPLAVAEVRIGALLPLSGPNAAAGRAALHGAQLAADLVNGDERRGRAGLAAVPALPGARLKIVAADTAGDPQRGAEEAARLVSQERVVGLLGAYDTAVTAAASQRAERLAVPFINADTPAGYLTERGFEWFFRVGPTDRQLCAAFFSLLAQEGGGPHRLAILYSDDKEGNLIASTARELATEGGHAVVSREGFQPGAPGLAAAVQRALSAQPTALLLAASASADATQLVRALAGLGSPPVVLVAGTGFSKLVTAKAVAGSSLRPYRSAAWSRPVALSNPAAQALMGRYEARVGRPMNETAAGAFTAVAVLARALGSARSVAPQRVRAALIGLDLPGTDLIMPWHGVRFDATQQNARAAAVVEQVGGGRARAAFPPDLASG